MIDKIQTTEAPNFIALDSGGRVIRLRWSPKTGQVVKIEFCS